MSDEVPLHTYASLLIDLIPHENHGIWTIWVLLRVFPLGFNKKYPFPKENKPMFNYVSSLQFDQVFFFWQCNLTKF